MKILFFLALFLVPYLLVSLPGVPRWVGRTIGAGILIFLMTGATFWFGFSPKSAIIRPGSKLSQPQFDRVRPDVEHGIRILAVGFGFFLLIYVTFPFASDLARLATGQRPLRIIETAQYKSVPPFGVWFLEQSVRFSRDGKSYRLFYSWEPLHVGDQYEFVVLPRSRFILDFRRIE